MKVGILTFHRAHNYGAVLQAYALQTHLTQMGHQVEIIDYRPSYIEAAYGLYPKLTDRTVFQKFKSIAGSIVLAYKRLRRRNTFIAFIRNHLNLSRHYYPCDFGSNFDYDAYVFGSDQIWNARITKGFDNIFFGDFIVNEGVKKIAYAASKESTTLDCLERDYFDQALKNFDALGVREEILAKLLNGLTEKKIETVLDPTLLVAVDEFLAIAREPLFNEKFVLLYQVRYDPEAMRIADELSIQLGARVVHIESKIKLFAGFRSYQYVSPEEFLGWFKRAECVVTTSFHGTAFAIRFNRPFYTINLEDGRDSRSENLLRQLGLLDRFVPKSSSPGFSRIDFTYANEKLIDLQQASNAFLKRHLSKAI